MTHDSDQSTPHWNAATPDPTRDDSLDEGPSGLGEAIAEYDRLRAAGQNVDPATFARQHPGLEQHLAEFFGNLIFLQGHADLITDSATEVPGPLAGVRAFGGYELLEELGRGGMGVVYKARQSRLGRTVALKTILAGRLASAEDVRRFHQEAEAAAKIDHPNVVPVIEVGEHEGQHFFSMGFVDGPSLSDFIAEGPLPPHQAAEVVRQIAEAVGAAHAKNIVHRDLKPANVLLAKLGATDSGGNKRPRSMHDDGSGVLLTGPPGQEEMTGSYVPKVTDFGLAKFERLDETRTELTTPGQLIGTAAYMSPEQAAGKEVGKATDIYALGALLYCLLTGRPPFQAATVHATIAQITGQEPVLPRRLNPAVHRDLETICLKCLEKEPDRRYGSARELVDDLSRVLNGEPIRARPGGPVERTWKWTRRHYVLVATAGPLSVALILSWASGTLLLWDTYRHEALLRQDAESARRTADAAASKQRRAAQEMRRRLIRGYVARGASELETGDAFAALPWFAEALRYEETGLHAETPHRVRLATAMAAGPRLERVLLDRRSGPAFEPEFSPDGRFLALPERAGIRIYDLRTWRSVFDTDTSGTLAGTAASSSESVEAVLEVTFSQDGEWLATVDSAGDVRVWRTSGGDRGPRPAPIFTAHPIHRLIVRLAFDTDGHRLAVYSGDLTVLDLGGGDHPVRTIKIPTAFRNFDVGRRGMTLLADMFAWSMPEANPGPTAPSFADARHIVHARDIALLDQLVVSGHEWGFHFHDPLTGGELESYVRKNRYPLNRVEALGGRDRAIRIVTSNGFDPVRVYHGTLRKFPQYEWVLPEDKVGDVQSLALSRDGQLLAVADERSVQLWTFAPARPATPRLPGGLGAQLRFAPGDERFLVRIPGTADQPGRIMIWRLEAERLAPAHEEFETVKAIGLGDRRVAALAKRRSRRPTRAVRLEGEPPRDRRVVFPSLEPDTTQPRFCVLTDLANMSRITVLEHAGQVLDIAADASGTIVATAGRDGLVRFWNGRSGLAAPPPIEQRQPVEQVALSPDGSRAALVSRTLTESRNSSQSQLTCWQIRPITQLITMKGLSYDFAAFGFSPDGRYLAAIDPPEAFVIDVESGKIRRLDAPQDETGVLVAGPTPVFSPDGLKLLGGFGAVAVVWETATGHVEHIFPHRDSVTALAWASEGRSVASGSEDGSARIWDATTGTPLSPYLRTSSPILSVSFGRNSKVLLTVAKDSADTWDARTGEPLAPSVDLRSRPHDRVWLTHDGGTLVRLNSIEASDVTLFSLEPDGRSRQDLLLLSSLIAGGRVDETSGITMLSHREAADGFDALSARPLEEPVFSEAVHAQRPPSEAAGLKGTGFTTDGIDPAWSPSRGGLIAYTRMTGGESEIWIVDADQPRPAKVASGRNPHWSGNGSTLYFSSADARSVMATGVTPLRAAAAAQAFLADQRLVFAAIAPDGTRVALQDGKQLVVTEIATGQELWRFAATGLPVGPPAWHPNGQYLAFEWPQHQSIQVCDLLTGKCLTATQKATRPAWSPTGHQIAFLAGPTEGTDLRVAPIEDVLAGTSAWTSYGSDILRPTEP